MRATCPRFMMLVNTSLRPGSKDNPLQLPPPSVLGNITIVPSSGDGVNIGEANMRFLSQRSRQYAACSGVSEYMSFAGSKVVLDRGAGLTGNGCVGHAASPGRVLGGTGLSSTPNTGSPVTRSKMNSRLIFVICA